MPNISGYKDLGGGLATLVFDDGQESQPVVLDDNLKAEVAQVASLVTKPRSALDDAAAALASGAAPSTPAPAALPPVPSFQLDQPSFQPAPPTSAVPTQTVPSVSDAAPEAPAVAPAGTGGLVHAGRVEQSATGGSSGEIRRLRTEAATAEEEANKLQVEAAAQASQEKARLIGERREQLDIEQRANEAEAARRKAAIEDAGKKWEAESLKQPDPRQAFASEPAWFKVLTAIGMALGTASKSAAILNDHDPDKVGNDTFVSVQKAIDESLANQKATKASEIARLTGLLGSERAALAAVEAKMYRAVEDRFQLSILKADNESEAAFARAGAARYRAKRLNTVADGIKETATATADSYALPKPVVGAGTTGLNPETREEKGVLAANDVDDKAYRKYTDERIKTGADAFKSSARGALDVVTKLTGGQDVPGSGPLDKLLQPLMRSEDAAAVQQTTGFLVAQFGKLISGASMTNEERALLTSLVEGRGTLSDWKRGIALLDNYADAQLETLNNGYPNETRAYEGISVLRQGRKRLTDEQQKRKDLQNKPAEAPAPATPAQRDSYLESLTPQQRDTELEYRKEAAKPAKPASETFPRKQRESGSKL